MTLRFANFGSTLAVLCSLAVAPSVMATDDHEGGRFEVRITNLTRGQRGAGPEKTPATQRGLGNAERQDRFNRSLCPLEPESTDRNISPSLGLFLRSNRLQPMRPSSARAALRSGVSNPSVNRT